MIAQYDAHTYSKLSQRATVSQRRTPRKNVQFWDGCRNRMMTTMKRSHERPLVEISELS